MNKKKIIGLCLAGVLAIGTIGGSLAWFTSKDTVKNEFTTASTDQPNDPNSGVDVVEHFDKDKASNTLPGDTVTKAVVVDNTATYSQLIRAKITPQWTDKDGNVIDHISVKDGKRVEDGTEGATKVILDTSFIQLNLTKNSNWTALEGDGYYYYNAVVEKDGKTTQLLDSVTLKGDTPNQYKGLKFNVIVEADGVQATNNAVSDAWKTAPDTIKALGQVQN